MFKKSSRKNFRRRQSSSESETNLDSDDETVTIPTETESSIEEAKELQKLRQRQHGVSSADLGAVVVEKKIKNSEKDPFKMKTGGFVDLKTLKRQEIDDEMKEQIGTTFASETNRRDEDAEMVKYVEDQMSKNKTGATDQEESKGKRCNAMDALYELPEHIKALTNTKKTSEDMLSNQMLSGIPEVDLGIEAKIKNIEQTEEAKQQLIRERQRQKEEGVSLVPTNYAVNFVQHNRFNIEQSSTPIQKKTIIVPDPVRVGDADKSKSRKRDNDRATDDFVYDKFKRQMRRY